MTTVLLTGFEPFGGETTNPSWTTVQEVARTWSGAEEVVAVRLPVDYANVDAVLLEALDRVKPDLVIAVGQAGGTDSLHVERVAINVDDARIPDNGGHQPIDDPVVAGGPAAFFSTLPIKATVAALGTLGIPAVISQTAGTFTCNHVFYRLMHELDGRDVRGGFVHVPFAPDQTAGIDRPSMSIETMVRGLTAILATTLAVREDAVIPGGTLH